MANTDLNNSIVRKPYPCYRRVAKIVLWTLMGLILAFYGTITCLVTVLSPDKLTPIVSHIANKSINADVDISKVEFSAMSTYPFLRLEIDSLVIVNPRVTSMKNDTLYSLPFYADTVFSVDRFIGELKLPALLKGEINVNNVLFSGLAVNVVNVNDGVSNYDIFPPSETVAEETGGIIIPKIVLRHFAIESPKALRYFDAETGGNADIMLTAELEKQGAMPHYRIGLGGNVNSPLLSYIKLNELQFGFDGDIIWSSDNPYTVDLNNCLIGLAFAGAEVDLGLDFGETFDIRNFNAVMQPLNVADLVGLLPDSLSKAYGLDALKTDASICLAAKLDRAYNLAVDTIPYATLTVGIPDCNLYYGDAKFDNLAAEMSLTLRGNDLNDALFSLSKLDLAGPATKLKISADVSEVITDPLVNARINGYTNLSKLPPPLLKFIDGYISGNLTAAVSFNGRPSMFDRNRFHLLKVTGDIDGRDLYWLSTDTANMVYVSDACLKFGTNKKFEDSRDLLAVTLKIDSADVLSGGTTINTTGLSVGIAAENSRHIADTTVVLPMGGGLNVKTLGIRSIADSAGVRIREIAGRVVMRRHNDMKRVPEFLFNLGIKRMAAGSPDARLLFSDSKLDFSAYKLPARKPSKKVMATADSIKSLRPDLSMDSVYALAIKQHRRSSRHRIHTELTDSTTEIIDWGTSKALGKLLLGWKLNGELSSRRAALFTPHFPLRNRLENLDIKFDNDSLVFDNLAYKVGRSDFLAAGKITNIRRSLTSRRHITPLKLQFESVSDTIDVNQIADGFFRGTVYGQKRDNRSLNLDVVDDDEGFEKELEVSRDALTDTMAPLLIPVNIEADIKVKANNILYSDLLLHDMTGNVLVYDGAVNLHQLKASSDVGSVDLSALYSAPEVDAMQFGFGMQVKGFNIDRFMTMVPALDSIMPLLRDISGIINADIAATSKISPNMDIDLPSLTAAIKIQGDSLQLLDAETFRTIAKWLMFKNKQRNIIDHMDVEMIINDNQMYMFPFIFDIDRYRLGVQGHNDLALNFNYLISVLKSPLPFKFGITLKGNPDDYKIRVGRAKFNEKQALERTLVVDTTRVNLIDQIENVFRRGVRQSDFAKINVPGDASIAADINLDEQPVSAEDSLMFIKEGLIPAPQPADSIVTVQKEKKND